LPPEAKSDDQLTPDRRQASHDNYVQGEKPRENEVGEKKARVRLFPLPRKESLGARAVKLCVPFRRLTVGVTDDCQEGPSGQSGGSFPVLCALCIIEVTGLHISTQLPPSSRVRRYYQPSVSGFELTKPFLTRVSTYPLHNIRLLPT
jgi:hypothetical protein